LLGIDDAPFDKGSDREVPVVGVMMEGADLVEAVALTSLPVDVDRAAERLADWISTLRFAEAIHGVVLGGVTIAGLGVIDIEELSAKLGKPVSVVNRRRPDDLPLIGALRAAGFDDRIPIVERMPRAWRLQDGTYVAHAGTERRVAERLVAAVLSKSQLPEPLRLAHMFGAAIVSGQSRGRP
jgi:endonuclease V-like protein UPF0215 family